MKQFLTLIISIVMLSSCAEQEPKEAPMTENILLKEWTGPYGGVPAFDKMNVADIKEAIIDSYEKQKGGDRSGLLNYFIANRMKQMIDLIDEF